MYFATFGGVIVLSLVAISLLHVGANQCTVIESEMLRQRVYGIGVTQVYDQEQAVQSKVLDLVDIEESQVLQAFHLCHHSWELQ